MIKTNVFFDGTDLWYRSVPRSQPRLVRGDNVSLFVWRDVRRHRARFFFVRRVVVDGGVREKNHEIGENGGNYRDGVWWPVHVVVDGGVCHLHGVHLQRHLFPDTADFWDQLESPKQFQLHDPCATVWVGSTMAQCKKFLDVSKFHENENVGDLGHYANAVWRVFENQQCDLFSKTFGFGV